MRRLLLFLPLLVGCGASSRLDAGAAPFFSPSPAPVVSNDAGLIDDAGLISDAGLINDAGASGCDVNAAEPIPGLCVCALGYTGDGHVCRPALESLYVNGGVQPAGFTPEGTSYSVTLPQGTPRAVATVTSRALNLTILADGQPSAGSGSAPITGATTTLVIELVPNNGGHSTRIELDFFTPSGIGPQPTYVAAPDDGRSVALSADGEVLASGGRASVFITQLSTGARTQRSPVDVTDSFGSQLSLSNDGAVLAVGESDDSCLLNGAFSGGPAPCTQRGNSVGAVHVFAQVNGALTPVAWLKAINSGAGDLFGSALALSGDGSTLAVGAPGEDSSGVGVNGLASDDLRGESGAVYVFRKVGAGWVPDAFIKSTSPIGAGFFGSSVALSRDGRTLAVGSSFSRPVEVFVRPAQIWQYRHTCSRITSQSNLRSTVALSAMGDRLLEGVPSEILPPNFIEGGAVYLSSLAGASCVLEQRIPNPAVRPTDRGQFGAVVSFNAAGDRFVVGVPLDASSVTGIDGNAMDTARPNTGAAWLFAAPRGQSATPLAYLKPPGPGTADGFFFGRSVAIASDTPVIAAGGQTATADVGRIVTFGGWLP